jgi:hypothetical protein
MCVCNSTPAALSKREEEEARGRKKSPQPRIIAYPWINLEEGAVYYAELFLFFSSSVYTHSDVQTDVLCIRER